MALDFVSGCLGGAAGVLVGFPLDTVKVRIQTQPEYTGTFQCLNSIIKREGVGSLYRGISSPLAGVAFINAICFGVYGNVNRRLENPTSIESITLAGSASGFVQAFACSPMELIKTRMQIGDGHVGVRETIKEITHQSGLRGLTKGLGVTICREVPAFAIYFSSYEYIVKGRHDNTPLIFAAGGLSGVFSWIFTYPLDVIKSRVQADVSGRYSGSLHCLMTSVKNEGASCLVRGVMSTVIRAFPTNAATMGVVALVMRALGKEETNVYDTLARMRMAESLYFELPSSFNSPRYKYHSNISTLCIDGPAIVQIRQPTFAVASYRLFAERMLIAMPVKEQHKELEVGTIRSGVKLKTITRLLTRMMKKKEEKEDANFHEMLDLSVASHDVIDSCFRSNVIIEKEEEEALRARLAAEEAREEEEDFIKAPSILLASKGGRILQESHVTTSDFLNTSSLISTSTTDRIYGFYYLM